MYMMNLKYKSLNIPHFIKLPCIQFLCLTIYWNYARFSNANKISHETKMISLFILKFEKHSNTLYSITKTQCRI